MSQKVEIPLDNLQLPAGLRALIFLVVCLGSLAWGVGPGIGLIDRGIQVVDESIDTC